jgi:hypothetical protein
MGKVIVLSREKLLKEIKKRRPEIHAGAQCLRCGVALWWDSAGLKLCAHCEPGPLWSYKTLELLAALQSMNG